MTIGCRAPQLYWGTLCLKQFPLLGDLRRYNLVEEDDVVLAQAVGSELWLSATGAVTSDVSTPAPHGAPHESRLAHSARARKHPNKGINAELP